jgi:hypothetical protein
MISIEGMNLNVDDWHGRPPAGSTDVANKRRASGHLNPATSA